MAVIIVIIGSLLPAASAPMVALGKLHINDKIEHFGAYAALGLLATLCFKKQPAVAFALFGCALLGVAMEFGQLYSPGRSFEYGDMLADALGTTMGFVFATTGLAQPDSEG